MNLAPRGDAILFVLIGQGRIGLKGNDGGSGRGSSGTCWGFLSLGLLLSSRRTLVFFRIIIGHGRHQRTEAINIDVDGHQSWCIARSDSASGQAGGVLKALDAHKRWRGWRVIDGARLGVDLEVALEIVEQDNAVFLHNDASKAGIVVEDVGRERLVLKGGKDVVSGRGFKVEGCLELCIID